MTLAIDPSVRRFRQRLNGTLSGGLRKTWGERIARAAGKGGRKDFVSIPMPGLEIPHFRHGQKGSGGVAQGEGEPGTPIGRGQGKPADGNSGGDDTGEHLREVDVPLADLPGILKTALELPNIELKGKGGIAEQHHRYNTIQPTGPEALRHFKRTYRRGLLREIASGTYNYDHPKVELTKDDKRYRGRTTITVPEVNAVAIYMLDVSGSVSKEQKERAEVAEFWIDTWLDSQYKGTDKIYIIFDSEATEVDQDTFRHTTTDGGTKISSALKLCDALTNEDGIKSTVTGKHYSFADNNIYVFCFSDSDNYPGVKGQPSDNQICSDILRELGPRFNLFAYGDLPGSYSSGAFYDVLRKGFGTTANMAMAIIKDSNESVFDALKLFLGKGV